MYSANIKTLDNYNLGKHYHRAQLNYMAYAAQGRYVEAIVALAYAIDCRKVAATRYPYEAMHARFLASLIHELDRIELYLDSSAHHKKSVYRFGNRLLVGDAIEAGIFVPKNMLPLNFSKKSVILARIGKLGIMTPLDFH